MNTFRQHLREMFDKPFRLVKTTPDKNWQKPGTMTYEYKGAEGGPLEINFTNQGDSVYVDFDVGGSIAVRGEGDAARVFASVMDAFGRFLKKNQPDYFEFSANKEDWDSVNMENRPTSRVRVYSAMIKRFAPKYGYELSSSTERKRVMIFIVGKKGLVDQYPPAFSE